jgi:hypothetical protein
MVLPYDRLAGAPDPTYYEMLKLVVAPVRLVPSRALQGLTDPLQCQGLREPYCRKFKAFAPGSPCRYLS